MSWRSARDPGGITRRGMSLFLCFSILNIVGYPFDSGDHNIPWLAIGGSRKGLPIARRFQACDGHGACVILDRPRNAASWSDRVQTGVWHPWMHSGCSVLASMDRPNHNALGLPESSGYPILNIVGYPFDSGDHNILWLAIGGPRKGLPIAPRFQACDGHGACVILDRPETQPRGPIACRPASGAPGCILGAVCWRPWIDQTTTPRGYLSQVDTPS